MITEFSKADLVICRAGATTCAELAAAGRPSVMVPLPTAADDHQRRNAEAMVAAGAARMILQKDLDGESIAAEIKEFLSEPAALGGMGKRAKELGRRDAAESTVELIESLSKTHV